VLAASVGADDDLQRLEVDDRVVDRHRELVLRLETDGGLQLARVVEVGQLEGADDDLLVGYAHADALAQARVLLEEGAERVGEAVYVGHFAVADDPGLQRREGCRLHGDAAVDGDLGDGDAAGVDVETDEVVSALGHVV
jgi:hypothetical protein